MNDDWDFDTVSSQDESDYDFDDWADGGPAYEADEDFEQWDESAAQDDESFADDEGFDTWDASELEEVTRPGTERWQEAFMSPEPGLRYDAPEYFPEDEPEPPARRRGLLGLLRRGARQEVPREAPERAEDDIPAAANVGGDDYSLDSILRGFYDERQFVPPMAEPAEADASPVAVMDTIDDEAEAAADDNADRPGPRMSVPEPEAAPPNETIAERSRRMVRQSFRQRLSRYEPEDEASQAKQASEALTNDEPQPEPEVAPADAAPADAAPAAEAPAREQISLAQRLLDELEEAENNAPAPVSAPAVSVPVEPPPRPKPRVTIGEDGIITLEYTETTTAPAPEPLVDRPADADGGDIEAAARDARTEPDAGSAEVTAAEAEDDTAAEAPETEDEYPAANTAGETPENAPEEALEDDMSAFVPLRDTPDAFTGGEARVKPREEMTFAERLVAPVVHFFATKVVRREIQTAEAENWPAPNELNQAPELPAKKAAKFYSRLAKPLRLRARIALGLCVILAWISLQLPMAGMLGKSPAQQAGVCLILTLAVMIAALDVVSTGLRQLFELRPGAEALATTAAFLSCLDAALVLCGASGELPFCIIGALALTASLWGQRLTCSAMIRSFRTAAESKSPSVLTSEAAPGKNDKMIKSLLRSPRGTTEGIVRRSEEQDYCQYTYAAAAPILLIAALLLAFFACLGCGWGYFLHTLSALVSVSASFAAFFGFALPYSLTARRLRASGAALAGYAGCADIAKVHRIVIGDEDLFPPGTTKFSEINILEGSPVDKVVAFTTALVTRSGSGVSSLFSELAARRELEMPRIEQYKCHEGGGLSGMIEGSQVLVGSAGFMNLMGIRLPKNLQSRNAICTAIDGDLMGVFIVEYTPTTSVQDALMTLTKGRTQAIFAIRDFNITPAMITRLFHLPTDNLNFPSFRDRYRIAAAAARKDSPINAVITRPGMLPLAEAAEAGRKLHSTCRINTLLSLGGGAVGMLIMFLLCRAGSFDTATAGNVLTFMLLWALPEIILSLGQNR